MTGANQQPEPVTGGESAPESIAAAQPEETVAVTPAETSAPGPVPVAVDESVPAAAAPTAPVAESVPAAAAAAAPPAPGAFAQAPVPAPDAPRLSLFLKISIVLLAAVSIAAIALLFVGSFEGNFVRIFSTFVIFTVFVLLTALDTRLDERGSWYAPVALIANAYILAVVLIVAWVGPYRPFVLGWEIFWKGIAVILVARLVLLCCQLLLTVADGRQRALGAFAFVTSVLAVLSGIMFTAPMAIEVFEVRIPELYWRIAVASLLLTALGLSITLLLRWFYGAPGREAFRQQREAARIAQAHAYASYPGAPSVAAYPQPGGYPQPAMAQVQSVAQVQTVAQPYPAPAVAQPYPAQPGVLPWPTFADGRPLPIGPDGRPDFTVPGAPPRP